MAKKIRKKIKICLISAEFGTKTSVFGKIFRIFQCFLKFQSPTRFSTLEKKEAQLNEVLAASNLDPTALSAVTRKLEDVLDGKNAAIKDLQYELARVCKAHNDVLRTYESRLKSFGVPVEELGFKPLESAVAGQQLGQGPAGLVAAPT